MTQIYLDDMRTPLKSEWIVVRNYNDFVNKVSEIGLKNIDIISLDHDLGDSAMKEFFNNALPNNIIDYNHITEKTGYDCAKWLVSCYLKNKKSNTAEFNFPKVYTHTQNPVGAENIIKYINSFLISEKQYPSCSRVTIHHVIKDIY